MLPPSSQVSPTLKPSLLSLPNEIITLILGYLNPEHDVWSLREAAPQLHEHIIQSLHGQHVDIDHTLFWCCQNGYPAGLVHILGQRPNLNRSIAEWVGWYNCHTDGWIDCWSQSYKQTPLALAAGNGHKKIVEILIQNGAKVGFGGRESYVGTAPIPLAASRGYHEITTLLFAHTGPRQKKKRERASEARLALRALTCHSEYRLLNNSGRKPAKTGVDRFATMRVLLKEGADIHGQDFEGKTHLHYMVESQFNHDDLNLRTLLDLGLDPNQKNNFGNTPLHIAAARTRPYLLTCHHIKLLVRYGCDVNARTPRDEIHSISPYVSSGYVAAIGQARCSIPCPNLMGVADALRGKLLPKSQAKKLKRITTAGYPICSSTLGPTSIVKTIMEIRLFTLS